VVEVQKVVSEVAQGKIGTIKNNFGFITTPAYDKGRSDIFFHFDGLVEPASVYMPKAGDVVEFEIGKNPQRGTVAAVKVRLVSAFVPTTAYVLFLDCFGILFVVRDPFIYISCREHTV
jgi:cold shock CspA family protein